MTERAWPTDDVAISIEARDGGGATVVVSGEIDAATLPVVAATTERLDAADPVVVDLSAVSFMDSMGLRWLIHLHQRAEQQGSAIRVVPSPAVWRLLRLSGLDFLIRER